MHRFRLLTVQNLPVMIGQLGREGLLIIKPLVNQIVIGELPS